MLHASFFFFNDTATTEIYTLSLHDALPISGIRPGIETVEYLEGVVTRITWGGALFLAAISILPFAIFSALGLPVFFGGTGIIIVVGVAIDTVQQIDAHLVMREDRKSVV